LVYDYIDRQYPDLITKFEGGLRYIKRVPEENDPTSAIGNSWKSMFKVSTREDAEVVMKEHEYTWEWI